jgi:hypothetical protein
LLWQPSFDGSLKVAAAPNFPSFSCSPLEMWCGLLGGGIWPTLRTTAVDLTRFFIGYVLVFFLYLRIRRQLQLPLFTELREGLLDSSWDFFMRWNWGYHLACDSCSMIVQKSGGLKIGLNTCKSVLSSSRLFFGCYKCGRQHKGLKPGQPLTQ